MKTDGRVALVLGGIKGIGKAICLDLLKRGIRVAATWYDWPESLASMQADFSAAGTDHLIERINLLETDAIQDLVDRGDAWLITWRTPGGSPYSSVIRKADLSVVSAGVCLDEREQEFDLQSLVSVMEEFEGGDYDLW